jgi:four helix bundle protein
MKPCFDHEKLDVYVQAIDFCGWVGDFLSAVTARAAAKDQLDRASTSVPLNIAEGNAKFSPADRARFFEIARGSAVECSACLDVLVARKLASRESTDERKQQLIRIVEMLVGLLRRFSQHADKIREEEDRYTIDYDYDHDQQQQHGGNRLNE